MTCSDPLAVAWADIGYNGRAFAISTRSGYRSSAIDENGLRCFLPPNASNKKVGQALLDAIATSRIIPETEFKVFFDWRDTDRRFKDWENAQCDYFGVKNIQSVNKNMMRCRAEVRAGHLILEAFIHVSTSVWKYFAQQAAHTLSLPLNSPPELVGAAIREAIRLCDGNGRTDLKFPEPEPD